MELLLWIVIGIPLLVLGAYLDDRRRQRKDNDIKKLIQPELKNRNFTASNSVWKDSLYIATDLQKDEIIIIKYNQDDCKVLDVQLGVDCDYYTKYKSVAYQPATMSFYNQNEVEIGNYPFMNAYINMKLSKARFYVMMSHVNQGLFGNNNYFSMPHYPLNPRKFQVGVSVDLAN